MDMFDKKRGLNGFSSFAWTFAIGAITGAAVALLYAPMTGKKMQKKVADVTDKVRDVVEDSVDNVQSVLRKVANA
jgi:gas vesicle protein